MNKNIRDYVKIYKNFLASDICDSTVAHLESCEFKTHKFYNNYSSEYVYNESEPDTYNNTTPFNDAIMQVNRAAILQYMTELEFPWCNSWKGYRSPKFNRYVPGTNMKEHCDHIHDLFDGNTRGVPILTIVCALNDNYQGGEFVLFQDEPYKLDKGDIIMFPSNFLYPHRVDTVTDGIRYSYASWVW